ncbi:MAG TPA: hypothetical protein VFS05_06230 [Gemmatimonadaceae bacterium]|nr:hypothetical protein [Gemmatimonadaceae bacterium]
MPDVRAVTVASTPLERLAGEADPPLLHRADVVEDDALRARPVPGAPVAAFAGFLDGAQESQVLAWVGAAPIVFGTVAAVVRERVNRRLVTSEPPLIRRRIYAPLAYAPADALLEAFPGPALVDTARPDADGALPPRHPMLLQERAKFAVSRDREALELALAERWCESRGEPLMIDGSIGGSERVSRAPCAVGVVKSHRTMYVDDAALEVVLALRRGERSSVFRISRERGTVDSWYLRLRSPDGRDALFGLVRVEVAAHDGDPGVRADEVSRWVLAESVPLAVPDPRWDRMAYGIRSCEEFLRAVAIQRAGVG